MADIYTHFAHSESGSNLSDSDSLGSIGYILLHRAATSLYTMLIGNNPHMTWSAFCQTASNSSEFLDQLCMVVSQAIQRFTTSNDFNFQAPAATLVESNVLGQMPNSCVSSVVRRVPQDRAVALASSLLIYAQSSHYRHRCRLIQCYTMDDYVYELADDAISRELMCGYLDAASRLDFKAVWKSTGNSSNIVKSKNL